MIRSRASRRRGEARDQGLAPKSHPAGCLVCACLAGAGMMALEVIWFRMLSMFVVNTTLAMSLMLAAVLSAIGLGALAASRWSSRNGNAHLHAPSITFALACAVVLSYESFGSVLGGQRPADWYRVLWLACWLTFPASLLSGVLLPLLGHALRSSQPSDTAAAGHLMMANTLGAMAGPLVAGFVLLPLLGIERSLVGIVVLFGFIAIVALAATRSGRRRGPTWTTGRRRVHNSSAAVLSVWPDGGHLFCGCCATVTADGLKSLVEEGLKKRFVTRKSGEKPIHHRLVPMASDDGYAVPGAHEAVRLSASSFRATYSAMSSSFAWEPCSGSGD